MLNRYHHSTIASTVGFSRKWRKAVVWPIIDGSSPGRGNGRRPVAEQAP
jgi:hypothetical protein